MLKQSSDSEFKTQKLRVVAQNNVHPTPENDR